ncbi:uncharacterized protein LOC130987688 isoform X2 [Salvia miltiorrhiza]|uniref:uncharacterized protein LOC130987688 isoform X2 n=1 Tax=Salvia miltiorrhiza TaxID=226208 RepID=UPI0025ABBE5F|nr:uncharacterized protein LOC130987688 isoform X2 [Salvia miltiorrhiza]
MLVANSFDLWQKDTFFSAAEEVQQSADIMESAYRVWLKSRKEGLISQHLDKLNRELQMALGTAKWQLEEFERAVCLSHRNNGDDITVTRHREFVSAIEDQISRVETALKDSLEVEGKKPFRWVNLDKEESDDLAHFLSGTPGTSQTIKNGRINVGAPVTSSFCKTSLDEDHIHGSLELQEREVLETEDKISYRADQSPSNLRAWTSPDRHALEIVVDTDDRETDELVEATPKEKCSKPLIWRSRGEIYRRAKEVKSQTQVKLINWINNHLRGRHRNQRPHVSPVLPVKSIRFVLALILTIFLFVPFVLHST